MSDLITNNKEVFEETSAERPSIKEPTPEKPPSASELAAELKQEVQVVLAKTDSNLIQMEASVGLSQTETADIAQSFELQKKLDANRTQIEKLVAQATFEAGSSEYKLPVNVGEVVDEKGVEMLIQKLEKVLEESLEISSDEIDACEKIYLQSKVDTDYVNSLPDNEIPGSYLAYMGWRFSGFPKEEVSRLVAAKNNNELQSYVISQVQKERAGIQKMLDKPENKEALTNCMRAIEDFYNELDVPIQKNKVAKTQYMGKFEFMLTQSEDKQYLSLSTHEGRYIATSDVNLAKLTDEEIASGVLSETKQRIFIHENLHSLSDTSHDGSAEEGVIDNDHTITRSKSGFQTSNKRNQKRTASYQNVNEEYTDLFARIIAKRKGLQIDFKFNEKLYDYFVSDAYAVTEALSNHEISTTQQQNLSALNSDQLKPLLQKYNSKNGIVKIGRELEQKVGRHAAMLYDLLGGRGDGSFARFLRSVKNPNSDEKVRIAREELKYYPLKEETLQAEYPFLEFVDNFDEILQ